MMTFINLNNPAIGELSYKQFSYPDGQPHCEFAVDAVRAAAEKGSVELVAAVRNGNDLLQIAMAVDALISALSSQFAVVNLNISYLLGARMDRRVAAGQPATLAVVAATLNTIKGIKNLRILDAHSPETFTQLPTATPLHPDALVAYVIKHLTQQHNAAPVIVIPDAGAVPRTTAILTRLGAKNSTAQCSKKRDSQTGKLSGFQFDAGDVNGKVALIVDDICDGGGTFAGIATLLRAQGATHVYLCVTHGIFSKGIEIDGIDASFCSDSYCVPKQEDYAVTATASGVDALEYVRDNKLRLVVIPKFVEHVLRG